MSCRFVNFTACYILACKMLEMVRRITLTKQNIVEQSNGAFILFITFRNHISHELLCNCVWNTCTPTQRRKLCTTISLFVPLPHKTFHCHSPTQKVNSVGSHTTLYVPSSFLVLIYHNFLNAVRSNLISVLFIVCFGFKNFSLFFIDCIMCIVAFLL